MAARFGTHPEVDGSLSLRPPRPHSSPGSPVSHQNAAPVAGVGECPPSLPRLECIAQGIRYGFRIGFDAIRRRAKWVRRTSTQRSGRVPGRGMSLRPRCWPNLSTIVAAASSQQLWSYAQTGSTEQVASDLGPFRPASTTA